MRKNY